MRRLQTATAAHTAGPSIKSRKRGPIRVSARDCNHRRNPARNSGVCPGHGSRTTSPDRGARGHVEARNAPRPASPRSGELDARGRIRGGCDDHRPDRARLVRTLCDQGPLPETLFRELRQPDGRARRAGSRRLPVLLRHHRCPIRRRRPDHLEPDMGQQAEFLRGEAHRHPGEDDPDPVRQSPRGVAGARRRQGRRRMGCQEAQYLDLRRSQQEGRTLPVADDRPRRRHQHRGPLRRSRAAAAHRHQGGRHCRGRHPNRRQGALHRYRQRCVPSPSPCMGRCCRPIRR